MHRYVCMDIWVGRGTYVCTHACVDRCLSVNVLRPEVSACALGGQRRILTVAQSCPHVFWQQGLSLGLEAHWVVSTVRQASFRNLPVSVFSTGLWLHTPTPGLFVLFIWKLNIKLRSLVLHNIHMTCGNLPSCFSMFNMYMQSKSPHLHQHVCRFDFDQCSAVGAQNLLH